MCLVGVTSVALMLKFWLWTIERMKLYAGFRHNVRHISFPSNTNATEVTMSIGHTHCCTATSERRTIGVALTLHKECGNISAAGHLQPTTNFRSCIAVVAQKRYSLQ